MVRASVWGLVIGVAAVTYLLVTRGVFQSGRSGLVPDQMASFRLFVDTRPELEQLESNGLGLSAHLGGDGRVVYNNQISSLSGFSALLDAVRQDLEASKHQFETIAASYGHNPRFFDINWLSSPYTIFSLTSVVVRPDRIRKDQGICGELRFIYRLGYRKKKSTGTTAASDLPMSVNMVYDISGVNCGEHLKKLAHVINDARLSNSGLLEEFVSKQGEPSRLEYNFQINRYPHDASETFSDQAHYGLAVLVPDGGHQTWRRSPLENTPDVSRLLSDKKSLAELWAWINQRENTETITGGVFFVPKKFLTDKSVSVTPNGILRLNNRPWLQLFGTGNYELPKHSEFASKAALLRRLDESTCAGCHVSRSIAGFHGLGQANNVTGYFNRMIQPMSAYFYGIQAWRQSIMKNPDLKSSPMPAPGRLTDFAAACGPDGGAFSDWSCAPGHACNIEMPTGSIGETGLCLPPEENYVGAPCDHSFIESAPLPLKDKWREISQKGCEFPNICTKSIYGFPGGFCTTGCSESNGSDEAGGTGRCSKIPRLGPFTECLEAGGNFADCLATSYAQVWMPHCGSHADCRPDYLCAATEEDRGICAPQYFLHQLTIENHPL